MTDDQATYCLNEAMRLAQHGYYLTPVTITRRPDGGKAARFHRTSWQSEGDVSADREQVRQWWVDHPDTSFAIVCGRSGVEAVDLDVKAGANAVTWWAEHHYPMGAVLVETPSGGLHLYWRRGDHQLPQTAGDLATGVDTRNAGGVLFAPGSYVVGEPGNYHVQGPLIAAADLPPTPAEVVDLFPTADKAQRPTDGAITEHERDWMRDKVDGQVGLVAHHDPAVGGFRHRLMGAAMMAGRLVEAGVIERADAVRRLRAATANVWGSVDTRDEEWIQTGLDDGPRVERWRVGRHGGRKLRSADVTEDQAGDADQGAEDVPSGLARFLLPAEVWAFSEPLSHIYRAAMARLVSPDVLLHAVLATIASLLEHRSRIETGKGPSTLSYYVAPVGASGAGKSQAVTVARELLGEWIDDRFAIVGADGFIDAPLGSGEGLIEAFMGEETRTKLDHDGAPILDKLGNERTEKVRAQVRHNGLFTADEGRQVLAIDSRKGATVLAVLCEMWSGATAGQTNAESARTRKLAAGTYVVGLIAGFQVATIDALFTDEAGGTPQRFLFAPAEYAPFAEDLDADDDEWPGELTPTVPTTAVTVTLAPDQRREVRRAIRAKAAGQSADGPLDGHRMLIRCRVAALLALLHGTTEVDDKLWTLARGITDRSCSMRDWLAEQGQRKTEEKRRAQQDQAVTTAVRASAGVQQQERILRAATQIVRAVEKAGGTESRGRALHGVSKALRDVRDVALDSAVARGLLDITDDERTVTLPSES